MEREVRRGARRAESRKEAGRGSQGGSGRRSSQSSSGPRRPSSQTRAAAPQAAKPVRAAPPPAPPPPKKACACAAGDCPCARASEPYRTGGIVGPTPSSSGAVASARRLVPALHAVAPFALCAVEPLVGAPKEGAPESLEEGVRRRVRFALARRRVEDGEPDADLRGERAAGGALHAPCRRHELQDAIGDARGAGPFGVCGRTMANSSPP